MNYLGKSWCVLVPVPPAVKIAIVDIFFPPLRPRCGRHKYVLNNTFSNFSKYVILLLEGDLV